MIRRRPYFRRTSVRLIKKWTSRGTFSASSVTCEKERRVDTRRESERQLGCNARRHLLAAAPGTKGFHVCRKSCLSGSHAAHDGTDRAAHAHPPWLSGKQGQRFRALHAGFFPRFV